jgi:hypothetical protein
MIYMQLSENFMNSEMTPAFNVTYFEKILVSELSNTFKKWDPSSYPNELFVWMILSIFSIFEVNFFFPLFYFIYLFIYLFIYFWQF